MIITNKNVKYELTDDFPNNVSLQKISDFREIIVWCSAFFPK